MSAYENAYHSKDVVIETQLQLRLCAARAKHLLQLGDLRLHHVIVHHTALKLAHKESQVRSAHSLLRNVRVVNAARRELRLEYLLQGGDR